jgi:hypothetical protein
MTVDGTLQYHAWLDAGKARFCGAWWRYDHVLRFQARRTDTRDVISGELPLFWKSGRFDIA